MEDLRLPKCVMFGDLVEGMNCGGGGQEGKEWMGCFLDDLRAFGINANQWTTAAQDKGEWHKTAQDGGIRGGAFHGKISLQRKPGLEYGMQ